MRNPKIVTVGFTFSGGYDVITSTPFSQWNVFQHHKHMATFNLSGRKDVNKHRALRILKKALAHDRVKFYDKMIEG